VFTFETVNRVCIYSVNYLRCNVSELTNYHAVYLPVWSQNLFKVCFANWLRHKIDIFLVYSKLALTQFFVQSNITYENLSLKYFQFHVHIQVEVEVLRI
jgi:hypothetical protein